MADDEDLKETVKEVLKEEDEQAAGEAALELLTDDDAYNIPKNDRNRLAMRAIKGAYIAPHYTRVVGLLSDDAAKKLSEDLGMHGKLATILEVLEDPEYRKHHNVIVSAAMANENIGTAQLYVAAIKSVSNEVKESLNTALGRDVNVSNKELASILGDPEFSAHRNAILRHVAARMDADELDEFFEEIRGLLSDEETARWNAAMARRRKYEAEHGSQHGSSTHDEDLSDVVFWVFAIVLALIAIATISP